MYPVIKWMALLKRRDGMERAAFRDYYETRHAPLIGSIGPEILVYRRNYVDPAGAFTFGGASIDFDVVTELHFADRQSSDRFIARCAEPDVARRIAEDEENLFDRAATRMMVVQPSDEPGGTDAPSGADRLSLLYEERTILRALARFARILDTKDWSKLGEVFAADLSFDYGEGERDGIAALREQMRRYLDRCGGTQHLLGSTLVDIDGDRATSRAYVQARHQRPVGREGMVFDTNGEYVDLWEKTECGWRIVRRDALWATHSGDAAILYERSDETG